MCPLCIVDVEHLLHVFFDCTFAKNCWRAARFSLNMSQVFSPPDWLLNKLQTLNHDESIKLAIILWRIWSGRNKKVWEDKIVPADIAMELSFNLVHEWKNARKQEEISSIGRSNATGLSERKWRPPTQLC